MSWYTVALFAHIVGVLTLFITLSLQWLITLRLRRAGSIAQAREWSGLAKGLNRIAPISGALILGAGMYMTAIAWSLLTTWVAVSLAAMVIMMIFGMGVVGRRLRAIQRAAEASTETIDAALQSRIDDPTLWVSMQMAVAVALSIVFMMTNKPNLAVSIVAVLVSLALGALVGILTLRARRQTQATALRVNEASVG
jgi:uncharacterized membrane protein